jgi:hypothetical protein
MAFPKPPAIQLYDALIAIAEKRLDKPRLALLFAGPRFPLPERAHP